MIPLIPITIGLMNYLYGLYLISDLFVFLVFSEIVYIAFFLNTDILRRRHSSLKVFLANITALAVLYVITLPFDWQWVSLMRSIFLVYIVMDALNILVFDGISGEHFKKSFVSTFLISTLDVLVVGGFFVYQGYLSVSSWLLMTLPLRVIVSIVVYLSLRRFIWKKEATNESQFSYGK